MKDEIDGFLKGKAGLTENTVVFCAQRGGEKTWIIHCVALDSAQWSLVVLLYFPWMCVTTNKVK